MKKDNQAKKGKAGKLDKTSKSANMKLFAGFAVAIMMLLFLEFLVFDYTTDDSHMVLRYAQNFVKGEGLVWNPGVDPAEGYTAFFVALIAVPPVYFGWDPMLFFKICEMTFSIISLFLLWNITRLIYGDKVKGLIPVLLLAATPAYAVWAVGGCLTQLYVIFLLAAVNLFIYEEKNEKFPALSSILFVGLAWSRPEGAVVFVMAALFRAFKYWKTGKLDKFHITRWIYWVALFGIIYTPWFIWRWMFYGYLFPAPFYIKTGANFAGVVYLTPFFVYMLPMIGLGLYSALTKKMNWDEGFMIFIPTVIALVVARINPSVGMAFRFAVPLLPFIYFFTIKAISDLWEVRKKISYPKKMFACLIFLLIFAYPLTNMFYHNNYDNYVEDAYMQHKVLQQMHIPIGKYLDSVRQPGESVAILEAGVIGYYSNMDIVIDYSGLSEEYILHTCYKEGDYFDYMKGGSKTKCAADYIFYNKTPDYIVLYTTERDSFVPYDGYQETLYNHPEFQKNYELVKQYDKDDDLWKLFRFYLVLYKRI